MTLKRSLVALMSAAVVSTAFFISACDDTTTTPTVFTPGAPINLMALSINDSTIRLAWTAPSNESSTDFKDYWITAVNGSTTIYFSAPKGNFATDIAPLAKGKTWTLTVQGRGKDTTKLSSSVSMDWATATRLNGLKAYEKSSAKGSGISLVTGQNLNVASGGMWDLCFDSDDNTFGSPGPSSYAVKNGGKIGGNTPKLTYIFAKKDTVPFTITTTSLDSVYDSKAISDTSTGRKLKVEGLVDVSGSTSCVMYVLTGDNHFAKIIVKSVGGKNIQSDADGKFVEINASVQSAANIPYAVKRNFVELDKPGIRANKVLHVTQ